MQIDALIQARLNSTRLPKKTLKKIVGQPMLLRVFKRASLITSVKNIVVATTDNPLDQLIVKLCQNQGITVHLGDEEDVLGRFVTVATKLGSDIVVRLTGDNPFLDPELAERTIQFHLKHKNDYTMTTGFPLGSACEIFHFSVLKQAAALTKNPTHHEHLGTFFLDNLKQFKVGCLKATGNLYHPEIRLTIDTPEDFKTAVNLYKHFKDQFFTNKDIIDLFSKSSEKFANGTVKQNYPTKQVEKMFTGVSPVEKS